MRVKIDYIQLCILLFITSFYTMTAIALNAFFITSFFTHYILPLFIGFEVGYQYDKIIKKELNKHLQSKRHQANQMRQEHIDEVFSSLKKDEENE